MPRIPYVDPDKVTDPEIKGYLERARREGTPRPESQAVRANVERMSAINPESGVLILAQERAPTGTLVEVVDQVRLGGIENITFSTTQ